MQQQRKLEKKNRDETKHNRMLKFILLIHYINNLQDMFLLI